MVTHEIWLEGGSSPIFLDLEDDRLFQQFKSWLQASQSNPGGWTGTYEGKTYAINFARVACMTIRPTENRRSMGFGS
jgi:hypothetical protein